MGRAGRRPARPVLKGGHVPPRWLVAAAALPVLLGALAGVPAATAAPVTPVSAASAAPFTGHGSIGEAYELGARPGTELTLVDAAGRSVGRGRADRLGSLIVRSVAPGPGYRFTTTEGGRRLATAPFRVLGVDSTPPASFYAAQHLHAGLNYLTMRDGIELAATVRLPPGKTLADGPFPTVIEYSGYATAAPGSLIDSLLGHPSGPSDLLPDTATIVGSVITPLLGFATVSLQMRGTGCSGGAFDLFGLPSDYDGYDAVQIVGSQPWVLHHKVGLVGISYSGISQLFVAGTRPPDLAAIAPLSTTDDLYSTGFPGGIFNDGFAKSWIEQRVSDARPAPGGGQPWATAEIKAGDRRCLANQALHLQAQNVNAILDSTNNRVPSIYDQRSPSAWATHIDVPVFMVGALEDEQTGPQWPAIIKSLDHDPDVFVTMLNGTHIDSLGPATITRWMEFLDIFVAGEVPRTSATLDELAPAFYQEATGAPSEPLPAVRFTDAPSVAVARADFIEQDPRVRVLFDNGGGSLGPGALQPEWEEDFTAWPPPSAVATTFALGAHGTLTQGAGSRAAGRASTVSFRPDPAARPATDLASSANAWAADPPYHWTPVTGSSGIGFVTPPLAHDEVVVGPGSLNLYLKSTAADTDLQATVSEVLPDGREMYVTSGFLRADYRALAPGSTALDPVHAYLRPVPLPRGRFVEVRIPIDPIGHAFRAGSRIRVVISAPGGDRPAWAFATPATGGRVLDTASLGGTAGSTLVLAVVPGVVVPDAAPACGALRGEPCRTYVPAGNGG